MAISDSDLFMVFIRKKHYCLGSLITLKEAHCGIIAVRVWRILERTGWDMIFEASGCNRVRAIRSIRASKFPCASVWDCSFCHSMLESDEHFGTQDKWNDTLRFPSNPFIQAVSLSTIFSGTSWINRTMSCLAAQRLASDLAFKSPETLIRSPEMNWWSAVCNHALPFIRDTK